MNRLRGEDDRRQRRAGGRARGKIRKISEVRCETCRRNARTHGWREEYEIGMAGALALADRDEFERAGKALAILRAALERLDRCETCAVATVTGGRCRHCKLAYIDGKPVPARSTTRLRNEPDAAESSPKADGRRKSQWPMRRPETPVRRR